MSLGSILQKVGTWISGIFKKASDELETVILPAVIPIVNAAKNAVDLDSGDLIGRIAGAAGANVEDKVRSILTEWVPKLQLAQQWQGQDPSVILANSLKLISNADIVTKTAFYTEFAGLVAHAWEDGKVDMAEAMALAKYWYENHPA